MSDFPRLTVLTLGTALTIVGSSSVGPADARPREPLDSIATRAPAHQEAAGDTVWFGGTHWNAEASRWEASLNGTWTFDSGVDDNWEGWWVRDLTEVAPPTVPFAGPDDSDFRWTHPSLYTANGTPGTTLFPADTPPDTGAIWCSKYEIEADELCYYGGQGYGNRWEHEAKKTFAYGGSGDIRLTYRYFNKTEANYDFTYLYLQFDGVRESAPRISHTGDQGSPFAKRTVTLTVSAASIPAGTSAVSAVFHFSSDAGLSDEDRPNMTMYGGFCCYNFLYQDLATPANSDEDAFETGSENWVFVQRPGVGAYANVTPLEELPWPPGICPDFQGNVLTFFDASAQPGEPLHPAGQRTLAMSPRIYLGPVGIEGSLDFKVVFGDVYMDGVRQDGITQHYWFREYPRPCPATGEPMELDEISDPYMAWPNVPTCWSGHIGVDSWFYVAPIEYFYIGIEARDECWRFAECTGTGGRASPWFDNIRVAVIRSTVDTDAPPSPSHSELAVRPNPFGRETVLAYAVPAAGRTTLRIFDTRGALVRTLVDETRQPGRYQVTWDGHADNGRLAPAGVYWARCRAGGSETVRRLVLLK